MRIFQFRIKIGLLLSIGILCLSLSACSSTPRSQPIPRKTSVTHNACNLFKRNPQWYWEALDTYYRWGVPVSVQMAIIQRESDFQAGARPSKKQLFGFIPWSNVSSAYGYAQALNGTWKDYQRETGQHGNRRNQFEDASDFIGWYCNKAHQQLGISKRNAYALYLAYHEGLAGYKNRTYNQKPWLLSVARTVQSRANQYRTQIARCKYSIPKVDIN